MAALKAKMAQTRVDTAKLALGLIALAGLIGCASLGSAPKLVFQCAHDLQFETQLYKNMALIEGQRGHVVLPTQIGRASCRERV